MAAKKSDTSRQGGSGASGATVKKGAVKKGAATKKGSIKSETAAKSNTPKAGAGKTGGVKAAGAKKAGAAAVKLNDRQREFLQKIHGAGEAGYRLGHKNEQRTIDALVERKLVKRGAKDKETGSHPYALTKTGQKHLGSLGTSGGGSTGGGASGGGA